MKYTILAGLAFIMLLGLISPEGIAAKSLSTTNLTYNNSQGMVSIPTFRGSSVAQKNCPSTTAPCDLYGMASRTKGRVDLSWRYTGKSFRGSFLVERSTDRKVWSVVTACKKSPTTSTSYSCSDTGLTSGKTYYYRACAITSGSKCGTTNLTPVASVRVP